MKKQIRFYGILFIFIVVISSLYGCGEKTYSLEGEWQFVSMIYGEKELTKEIFEASGDGLPALKCTKNEYTLTYFDTRIRGIWESTGDKEYSFFLSDGFKVYSATLKSDKNNKHIMTLRDSDEVQRITDDSDLLTLIFER